MLTTALIASRVGALAHALQQGTELLELLPTDIAWIRLSWLHSPELAFRLRSCMYPLPLYANAALRDPIKGAPGTYESGGPTDNVLPIWKAEAPAIDILAPDNYLLDTPAYLKVMELYHRPDNALFIPETAGTPKAARFLFAALGLQSIGYSPFGLDYTRTNHAQPS